MQKNIVLLILFFIHSWVVKAQVDQPNFSGKASYYHPRFKGQKTASGERYNPKMLTAAHKHLPFGTVVKVTNTSTGQSVNLRINDRGPYSKHRILDVSSAAAKALDMMAKGSVHISCQVVPKDYQELDPRIDKAILPDSVLLADNTVPVEEEFKHFTEGNIYNTLGKRSKLKGFGFQVNTFKKLSNAQKECSTLLAKGLKPVFIEPFIEKDGSKRFKIIAGCYKNKQSATLALAKTRQFSKTAFVRKLALGNFHQFTLIDKLT